MGDIGDYWREAKKYKKEQKEKIRTLASGALEKAEKAGLSVRQLSEHHWRVSLEDNYIDWWVGTGTWISKKGKRGWGVKALIKEAQTTRE